jgi:hypothetical protein
MTTIARLAAVVTTDTAQFNAGMSKAGQVVERFGGISDRNASFMSKMGVRMIATTGVFGRFGGVVGQIAGSGSRFGLMAAGLLGAAAAAGALTLKLAHVADAARDMKIEAARDFGRALAESQGVTFVDNSGLRTSKELMDEIKQSISDFAEMSGLSLTGMVGAIAETIRGFNILWYGEEAVAAQDAANAKMKQQVEMAKQLREETARRGEEEKQAIAAIQRDMEQTISRMQSRASSLADSLRTPAEKFRDSLKEIDQLRSGLFINDEIFSRGITRAADEYQEAAKKLMEAKSASTPVLAGLQRGSIAEQSFRLKNAEDQRRLEALQKEEVKVTTEVRDEVRKLNNKPTSTIKIGRLT